MRRYVQVGFRLKQHSSPVRGANSTGPKEPESCPRRRAQRRPVFHTKLCSSTVTRAIFETTVLQHTHSDVLQPFKTALQLCIPDSSDLHVDQALITVLLHCNGRDVLVL